MDLSMGNVVKLSIVIPVYNMEKYIEACLDSILERQMREIEVICVDDVSTDSSPEIMRQYAERDCRVRVITQPQNAGQAEARNTGLEAARGEYVYFLDSDDMAAMGTLEWLYDLAHEHTLDGLFFNLIPLYETQELRDRLHGGALGIAVTDEMEAKGIQTGEKFLLSLGLYKPGNGNPCLPGTYFWRREFLLAHGIRNPLGSSPHEDNAFFLKAVLQAGRMMMTTKVGHIRRMREGSVMSGQGAKHLKWRCRGLFVCWMDLLGFLQGIHFQSEACRKLAYRYANDCRGQALRRWQSIPVSERGRVVFKNQMYQMLFDLTVQKITELEEQANSAKKELAREKDSWRKLFLRQEMPYRRVWWGEEALVFIRMRNLHKLRDDLLVTENASLQGQVTDGLTTCAPEVLRDLTGTCRILVFGENYASARAKLTEYGYREHVDFRKCDF